MQHLHYKFFMISHKLKRNCVHLKFKMYKRAIIFTFLLYQIVSCQAKCRLSDQSEEFINVNYTFNQQNNVDFGSLEISGFEHLRNFFENCQLAINDMVEFSLEYKFKKGSGSSLWKPFGKPFDVLNKPGRLDAMPKKVEHNQSIQPCKTFKLRIFSKIYTNYQKTNQRHRGSTLKTKLKNFNFGPKPVEVSPEKTQATTAVLSWKIDDLSSACVQKYQVQVDGESKDANLIQDGDTVTILNLMPCSTHKVKVSPIYKKFIGIADPIDINTYPSSTMVEIEKNKNEILIYPEKIKRRPKCSTSFISYGYIMYFKSNNEPDQSKVMIWKDNIRFDDNEIFLKTETITLANIRQQLEAHDKDQPDLKYENCSIYSMEIHMKFKKSNNEEYEMPLLGLENVTLYSMRNFSLTFDNDVNCSTGNSRIGRNVVLKPRNFDILPSNDNQSGSESSSLSKAATSNTLIIAVVCGIILVTTIVGFFIMKKSRENKENVAGKPEKNKELDDVLDMEQQSPIVKQVSN